MPHQTTLIFDPSLERADMVRVMTQQEHVRSLMKNGDWWTYEQLQEALAARGVSAGQNSISARVRQLRKPSEGGYAVERKKVGEGLFAYRATKKR